MADLELVREDGAGERTVLTVRVPDAAWKGRETRLYVVARRRTTPVPQQRRDEALQFERPARDARSPR